MHCEHCEERRPFHADDCIIPLVVEALRVPVEVDE